MCLVAETTKGTVYFSEGCGGANIAPEDVAEQVSKDLLKKINFGGVVDCRLHRMLMLMMSCGPSDLFKAKIGAPSSLTQSWLRELDTFMGVAMKMRNCTTTTEDESAARCVNISVTGTGLVELWKTSSISFSWDAEQTTTARIGFWFSSIAFHRGKRQVW